MKDNINGFTFVNWLKVDLAPILPILKFLLTEKVAPIMKVWFSLKKTSNSDSGWTLINNFSCSRVVQIAFRNILFILTFRKKEGVQLNMALAETYYFNLKVCSDDANLDQAGIASCCGKTESQAWLNKDHFWIFHFESQLKSWFWVDGQALITVEVTDENINAPNFDFYIGEDQIQNIPEGTLQEDDTGKSIVKLRTVFMLWVSDSELRTGRSLVRSSWVRSG